MSDIQNLTASLDLKQNLNIYAACKQSDNLKLILLVYDNSIQANLTNYTVRMRAMKADKVPLIQEHTGITITNNVVTIVADEQLTTTHGKTLIELQFINSTTGEKKATFNLVLVVSPSTFESDRKISIATYTLLQELENKLDQATDYFQNVKNFQNEHPDLIDLDNRVTVNTASLLEKANLSDVKVFTSLSDIGLLATDMTTDFATNISKIITAMGRNRKIILYPYQTESNTNLYNSLKTWCGVNTDAYRLVIETAFTADTTISPNKIEVYPNGSDGNNKYLVGFYDNSLGTCKGMFLDDSGWINISLQSGITVNSTYAPQYRKIGSQVFIRGSVKGVTSSQFLVGILPVGFRPGSPAFYANFKSNNAINSLFINTLGEIRIVGNTLNTYDALDFNDIDINFSIG